MNYQELFNLISKPWASVKDIKKIANCGRDRASKIRDTIILDIINNGKNIPIAREKIVPMENVISYLNLNLDYIFTMAQKEKLIQVCK